MKADLYPGDVLLIPTMWLHDVEYIQAWQLTIDEIVLIID